jgi:branched-chain amino acid transport system substrate-binding protein
MRKILARTAIAVAMASCPFATRAADAIKIGAPFNVTGALSSLDAPALNGVELKAREINDAGGVLGRKIELVVYDTKADAATIASVANRLIAADHVHVALGFTDSDSVLAFGPIFQKAEVPFVTPGATSPKLPGQIGDMIFLASFGDNVQAAAGADFIRHKLAGSNVFLLRDNATEYTKLLAGYFEAALSHGGGSIVGRADYASGDKSFAAEIATIKASAPRPDVLYVSAMPDDIGLIVKALRAAGLEQPIVGGDGYDTPLLVEVGGAAANGVYFSTHAYMAADSTPPVQKFYRDYRAAYGTDPENAFAALGYDAVGLIADAIKRAGTDEAKAIRDAIAATAGYVGVTGTISYPNEARVPAKTVTMIAIKGERPTLAAEVNPGFIPPP